MKHFTNADVSTTGTFPTIVTESFRDELVHAPTKWQKLGLQQTASGYGRKLNSGYKISFNGKMYRVYTTIYSNAGSFWFTVKGRQIYVH